MAYITVEEEDFCEGALKEFCENVKGAESPFFVIVKEYMDYKITS